VIHARFVRRFEIRGTVFDNECLSSRVCCIFPACVSKTSKTNSKT
jgi:hypothetical protein